MKHKAYLAVLGAVAVISAGFAIWADSSLLISLFSFPFAQLGSALRTLSLSGVPGNLLAWAIYLTAAAIPAVVWLRLQEKCPADLLLVVLTPVLLVVLYKMVNPFGSLYAQSPALLDIYKAQFGAVVYVILLGWMVLRVLYRFRSADQQTLYYWLGLFAKLLGAVFVVSAFGGCFSELLAGISNLKAGNTNSGSLTMTYVFLGLQCLVDAAPLLMDTVAVLLALELLEAMRADRDDQGALARKLSDWCGLTLTVTTIGGMGFHLLQMVCMDRLRDLRSSVVFPVMSIGFLLVCMAAARLIGENKALRDENDLYI